MILKDDIQGQARASLHELYRTDKYITGLLSSQALLGVRRQIKLACLLSWFRELKYESISTLL